MTYLAEIQADSPAIFFPMREAAGQRLLTAIVNGFTGYPVSGGANAAMGYSGPDSLGGAFWGGGDRWHAHGPIVLGSGYTVETWFYLGSWAGSIGPPLGAQVGFASGSGFLGSIQASRGSGNTGASVDSIALVGVPQAGAVLVEVDAPSRSWHHCMLTDDGVTVTLYVDGLASSARASTGAGGVTTGFDLYDAENILIGPSAGYTTALSAARVGAHFAAADRRTVDPAPTGGATLQRILDSVYRVYPLSL